MFWYNVFQCSIILVVKGLSVLICIDEVIFSRLLKQIPDLYNCLIRFIIKKNNSIYVTFLLLEHISVLFLYLDSII